MGSKTFRSVDDFARHGCNIQVECRCGHTGVVCARQAANWFLIHRWPRAIEVCQRRFRCSRCRKRGEVSFAPCPKNLPLSFPKWGPQTEGEWKRKMNQLRG